MYICNECHAEFEEPEHSTEPHGEPVNICPGVHCGSTDIIELTNRCQNDNCCNWTNEETFCDECQKDIIHRFYKMFYDNFSLEEMQFISDFYETRKLFEL